MINDNNVLNIESFYHSPNNRFNTFNYKPIQKDIKLLNEMFSDKNCFFSINGDFNAKNTRWGKKTHVRGENLLQWTTDMDLNIVKFKSTNTS